MLPRRSRLLYTPPRYSGASPFETSPRRAPMMSGRCSMPTGHWFSHAPQVVHCHSTSRRVEIDELRVPLAREQRLLRLQNQRLRIEFLPRAPGRTVHLAASALDAREGIEHSFAAEILHGFKTDLLLLEVEVRDIAELERLEEHGNRRQTATSKTVIHPMAPPSLLLE